MEGSRRGVCWADMVGGDGWWMKDGKGFFLWSGLDVVRMGVQWGVYCT